MAGVGASAPIAVLVAQAEISNLLNVILGSRGAIMCELALGAAAVEGGNRDASRRWRVACPCLDAVRWIAGRQYRRCDVRLVAGGTPAAPLERWSVESQRRETVKS
jgi:hypothetical protein